MKYSAHLFIVLIGLSTGHLFSQQLSNKFVVSFNDASEEEHPALRALSGIYKEMNDTIIAKKKTFQLLYKNGYLAANLDSLTFDSLRNYIIYLSVGKQYKWLTLKKGNAEEELLHSIRLRTLNLEDKIFNPTEIEKKINSIIHYYESSGYPFCHVKLNKVQINEGKISAELLINKGKLITIDSLTINGSNKISKAFLSNYIGIREGDPYNEVLIKKSKNRFKELPFVNETQSPEILFATDYTKINFFLEDKKASQFNGILGILPDNNHPGKILFTGDAFIKLQNSIAKGELIELNWKKLQTETQDLNLHLAYPFILSSPFGVDYKLSIYKRDSTFLTVGNILGLQYRLNRGNFLKVYYQTKNSGLLQTKIINPTLPVLENADVSSRYYGLEFKKEELDYKYNPRKGYSLHFSVAGGSRKINKNSKLNDAFYEGLQLHSNQFLGENQAQLFFPLFSKATFLLASKSASITGKQLFNNELYRIGGLKSLRGFDEESIFASTYSILNLELRYLLEENSYAHVFWNGAWYENSSSGSYSKDTPFGFGLGISFESKPGIFSINYALGKQFDNPILIRAGKVHFGFVSYF